MSWGSSNDSNYGDSSGTSGSSSSSSSKGSSGGKYSIYINIGLAILAVLILLFLIGAYYNKKSDSKPEHFTDAQQVLAKHPSPPTHQSSELLQQQSSQGEVQPQKGIGKNEVFASVPNFFFCCI